MRRLVATLLLAVAAGLATAPSSTADASCDSVLADLPILTNSIQTEYVVDNCSARTSVRITLSEFVGGDWERGDCDGGVDNCTIVRPTGVQDCSDGTLFCAHSTIHKTEVWNQNADSCSRPWRAKITVRNPDGDVIAQDTSPANSC